MLYLIKCFFTGFFGYLLLRVIGGLIGTAVVLTFASAMLEINLVSIGSILGCYIAIVIIIKVIRGIKHGF